MADEENTTPSQPDDLSPFIAQAQAAVNNLHQIETQAGELLGRVDATQSNVQSIQDTINTQLNEIQNNVQLSEGEKAKIIEIGNQVNQILESCKNELAQVQTNVQEIQDVHKSFTEIKNKIFDDQTGLEATLTQAQQKLQQIENHQSNSESLVKTIQEKLDVASAQFNEIEQGHQRFLELDTKITDEENGLDAVFEWAQETKAAIEKEGEAVAQLHKQMSELWDRSNITANKITEAEKKAAQTLQAILDHKQASETTKQQIEKILGLVTDRGLAHAFSLRSENLSKARWVWLGVMVACVLGIGLMVFLIFREAYVHHPDLLERGYIWFRIAGTSPLVFLAFFAGSQYSKERDLLERYAFKEAAALGLESYTNLLTRIFTDEKYRDIILTFVLDGMTKIYEEPYEPWKQGATNLNSLSRFERWKLSVYERLEQAKSMEFSEKTETTVKTSTDIQPAVSEQEQQT